MCISILLAAILSLTTTLWLNMSKSVKKAKDLAINSIYYCNKYYSSPDWFGIKETLRSDGSKKSEYTEENWLGETITYRAKRAINALDEFNLYYIKHRDILNIYSKTFEGVYNICQNLTSLRASHRYTWNNINEFKKEHMEDITKLKKYQNEITKASIGRVQKILIKLT